MNFIFIFILFIQVPKQSLKMDLQQDDEQPGSSSHSACNSSEQDSVTGSVPENKADVESHVHNSVTSESSVSAAAATPAQDRISNDIAAVKSEITALVCRRNIN